MSRQDPFDFFRQHLPESQKRKISIEEERKDTRLKTEYPIFTFAPLTIGILDAFYSFFIWLGIYSGLHGWIVSLGLWLERYSGIVLAVNALTLIFGLFGLFLSNKKKLPIAAMLLCFLVSFPLASMYLIYIHPTVTQGEAISIANSYVPKSITRIASLTPRWNQQNRPHGEWEVEYSNVNITADELGWTNDPNGSPSVILYTVGDSGIPERTFKVLRITLDGKTGHIISKTATAAQNRSSTNPQPQAVLVVKVVLNKFSFIEEKD